MKQQVEIKQLLSYQPIAKGGQKLAALDKNGVVLIYDEVEKKWYATNRTNKENQWPTYSQKLMK